MTLRQQGVLRVIVCLVGIAVVHVAAQDSGSSFIPRAVSSLRTGEKSYYSTSSASYSSSNDEDAGETAAYIARGYASTMDENEQRLTIINDSLLMESVCDGGPVIILKSTTVPANGACLPAQSRYNLSCSCLSGFANKTSWDFHIRASDKDAMSPFPTTFSNENIVQVNSLMLLTVPSDLLTLYVWITSCSMRVADSRFVLTAKYRERAAIWFLCA